jgi:hypothetical protein
VITLAPQPTHKGTLQELCVKPIRFGPPMIARYRRTRRMNHMRLNARALSQRASSQKPSQPASKATAMREILFPTSPLHRASDKAT